VGLIRQLLAAQTYVAYPIRPIATALPSIQFRLCGITNNLELDYEIIISSHRGLDLLVGGII
jgi:hypothetical protein